MTGWLVASGGIVGLVMAGLMLYYRHRAVSAEGMLLQLNSAQAAQAAALEKMNAERTAALVALKKAQDDDEAKDRAAVAGDVAAVLRSGISLHPNG